MAEPPTSAEIPIIEEFRAVMVEELPKEKLDDDVFLLRWLRARDLDIKRAAQMLRASLQWRQENKVDSVLNEGIDKEIADLIDGFFQAFDKFGRPVVALPGGEWEVRQRLDDGGKPELIKFLIQSLEIFGETLNLIYTHKYPSPTQVPIGKFTIIFDLKGFTYAKMVHKKSVETLIDLVKIYEANYPESLGKCIIINSPRIFALLFAIVKPFLHPNTVSKISIFDSNEKVWRKEIESVIDPFQLPERYGGIYSKPAIMDD